MIFSPTQNRPKPRAKAIVAQPVLPNYTPLRDDRKSMWRRRRRYAGFAAFSLVYGFLFSLLPPNFLMPLLVPLAVLALLIVWALPIRNIAPSRAMTILLWCFWLSLYLWPNYLALALPGLPWITVNRLFGGPLLFLLLVNTSTSRPFREGMADILRHSGWIWKMIAAFAVSALISTAFSPEPFTTLNKYLNLQIVWTAMFFASIWVLRKPGNITTWARLFVLMAIITSIIGLFEAQRQQILWADSIPSFLKVEDPAVLRLLNGVFRGEQYRIASTTMSPLSFAEFLALSTPFLIHFFITSRSLISWMLLIAADVLIFVAILNTDARLGMVGFLLAHSTFGLLWAIRRWRSDKNSLFGPAITLAYPALLALFTALVFSVGRLRVLVSGDGRAAASNESRIQQYFDAMPVLAKSPIFGYGSGQGGPKLGFTGAGGSVVTVDSYVISVALDFGIVGFILFYGLALGGMFQATQIAANAKDDETAIAIPIAICLGIFLFIKTVLAQEANNTILFMLLGIIAILAWRQKISSSHIGTPNASR